LLVSQRSKGKVEVVNEEMEDKKLELKEEPELNSLVEPPKEQAKEKEVNRLLLTVKSDSNLRKSPLVLESPREELNNSG
jgi:hypothetical protein